MALTVRTAYLAAKTRLKASALAREPETSVPAVSKIGLRGDLRIEGRKKKKRSGGTCLLSELRKFGVLKSEAQRYAQTESVLPVHIRRLVFLSLLAGALCGGLEEFFLMFFFFLYVVLIAVALFWGC